MTTQDSFAEARRALAIQQEKTKQAIAAADAAEAECEKEIRLLRAKTAALNAETELIKIRSSWWRLFFDTLFARRREE